MKLALSNILQERLEPKHLKHISRIEETEKEFVLRFNKPGQPNKRSKPEKVFQDRYCRVVTGTKEDRAEIFLYGYIGQDFWWDDELNEESITDLAFVRAMRELEKDYKRIDIRINSPGGSVLHGDPIITAIRGSRAEVHTYIDGIAASMAADIWIAGHKRHMAVNSKLMIHSTSTIAFGTAKDMRNVAKELDTFDNAAINTFVAATGMSEEDVRQSLYDYEDHWMSAADVAEMGLIEKVEEYEVEQMPDNAERLNYADLVRAFSEAVKGPDDVEDEKATPDVAEITEDELMEAVRRIYGPDAVINIAAPQEIAQSEKTLDHYRRKAALMEKQMTM